MGEYIYKEVGVVVGVVVGGGERCRGGRVKDVSNIYIYK